MSQDKTQATPVNTAEGFTATEMDAAVKKLLKAGVQMTRGVEQCLVMAVYDSIVNESANMANALIGALRVSTKRDGIIAFLHQFGQLHHKGGKKGFVHFALGTQQKLAWTKDYVETVKDAAMTWEAFKPAAPAPEAFDVVKAVESVVKKANKANEEDGPGCVDGELVEYLSALLAQYTSKKALAKAQETAKQFAGEIRVAEQAVSAE
jgi:hypothetical protein